MDFIYNVFDSTKEEVRKEYGKFEELCNYDFKLPIEYNNVECLDENLKEDIEFHDISNNIMKNIFSDDSENKENQNLLLNKWCSLYTTNKSYLKENQSFVSKYEKVKPISREFINLYQKYRCEDDFLSKYQYVDFDSCKYLNENSVFLQCLGVYNLMSPVLTLLSPIIGLILPYFIFMFKGIRLSFSNYLIMVKNIIVNNHFINGIINFHKNSLQTNGYLIFSIVLYEFSTYQNIIFFKSYLRSIQYLQKFIKQYYDYLNDGLSIMNNFIQQTKKYRTFNGFHQSLLEYKMKSTQCLQDIASLYSSNKKYAQYGNLGVLLRANYRIFYNEDFNDCFHFITYLNQYQIDICKLQKLICDRKINKCTYSTKKKGSKTQNKPCIIGGYYLNQINDNHVNNDLDLQKNIIITGPNASGKTTMIKSSLINLFLSQSIGFGCYERCRTHLYDEFHSYLNIPDTSNRDSLFQAEARRCKEIWSKINKKDNKRHFCIFDEIYSGTNPRDAVSCAKLYLNAMNKKKSKVDFVLTTHYIELCENFHKNEESADVIVNKKMKTEKGTDEKLKYHYKIIDGICKLNGGLQILEDLEYPQEIMRPE